MKNLYTIVLLSLFSSCVDQTSGPGRQWPSEEKIIIDDPIVFQCADSTLVYKKDALSKTLELNQETGLHQVTTTPRCDQQDQDQILVAGVPSTTKESVYFYFQNSERSFDASIYDSFDMANPVNVLSSYDQAGNLINSYNLTASSLFEIDEEEAQLEILTSPNSSYVLFDRALPRTTTQVINGVSYRNYTLGSMDQIFTSGRSSLRSLPVGSKKDLNNFGELVVEKKIYSLSSKIFLNLQSFEDFDVEAIDPLRRNALINDNGMITILNYETFSSVATIDLVSYDKFYLRDNLIFATNDMLEILVVKFDLLTNTFTNLLEISHKGDSFDGKNISVDGRYITLITQEIVVIDLERKIQAQFPIDDQNNISNVQISDHGKTIYAFPKGNANSILSNLVIWVNPLSWINP